MLQIFGIRQVIAFKYEAKKDNYRNSQNAMSSSNDSSELKYDYSLMY